MLYDYHVHNSVSRCCQNWELFFTKLGAKTNGKYCWDILLCQQILELDAISHTCH